MGRGSIFCEGEVDSGSVVYPVASKLNDPICHSDECQIGSFSSEATRCLKGGVIYRGGV